MSDSRIRDQIGGAEYRNDSRIRDQTTPESAGGITRGGFLDCRRNGVGG